MIFHIVKEREYLSQIKSERYLPDNFNENGFVHCALQESVIPVANDCFSDISDRLLLLKIDPLKLKSETRYEPAAPVQGAGTGQLSASAVFPHVYGPIDNSAIMGVGILGKGKNGYEWPQQFLHLTKYLLIV